MANIEFITGDVRDPDVVRRARGGDGAPAVALVCGLHCCGGLSETAAALAAGWGAAMCICTCCFCSNPQLAVLTAGLVDEAGRLSVARLAESQESSLQRRAMFAVNRMRLCAAAVGTSACSRNLH